MIEIYKIQNTTKPLKSLDYNHYLIDDINVSLDLTYVENTTYFGNIFSHETFISSHQQNKI